MRACSKRRGASARAVGYPVTGKYRRTRLFVLTLGYRVAAALVGLGNAIKIVGAVLAGLIVLGFLSCGNSQSGGSWLVLGSIFFAIVVGVLFWVCRVMPSSMGNFKPASAADRSVFLRAVPGTAVFH